MAGEADGLQIPVSFTLDEARSALATLQAEAARAGVGMKESVEKPAEGFASLEDRIRGYRREQMQEAGTVRFLAREIQDLVPVGSKAAEVLGKLGFTLASGSLWAVGFEAAKMAFTSYMEKAAKAREEAAAFAKEMDDLWSRVAAARTTAFAKIGAPEKSEVEKAVDEATSYLKQQIDDKREELRKLNVDMNVALRRDIRSEDEIYGFVKKKQALQGVIDSLEQEYRSERQAARGRTEAAADRASETAAWAEYYRLQREAEMAFRQQEKQLSRDAMMASMDERQKIRQQLAYQIQDLQAFGVADDRTRRAIGNARIIAVQRLREIEFRDAKSANDKLRAMQEEQLQWEQNEEDRRADLREKAAMFRASGFDFGRMPQLEALEKEKNDRLALLNQMVAEEPELEAQAELARTRVLKDYSDQRIRILQGEKRTFQQDMAAMGMSAMQAFAGDVARSFGAAERSSRAYEHAMRSAGAATQATADFSAAAFAAFAQNAIASVSEESATRAVFETAMGLAALARSFWDPTASTEAGYHFAAAAEFAAVSTIAGAVAYGIGQTRGMTASERASVASASASSGGTTASSDTTSTGTSGAREVTSSGSVNTSGTTREIILVVGDPFESPQETARRVARRMKLAKDLNLVT